MVPLYIISSPARLSRRSRATETTLFVRRGMKKWPEKRARPASCPVNSVAGSHIAGSGRVGGGHLTASGPVTPAASFTTCRLMTLFLDRARKREREEKAKGKKRQKVRLMQLQLTGSTRRTGAERAGVVFLGRRQKEASLASESAGGIDRSAVRAAVAPGAKKVRCKR